MVLSLYLSIYLIPSQSIYPTIYLSIYLSIYVSIYLSIYLSIDLSVYQSVYLSICLCMYLSMHRSIYLPFCLPVYPSLSLSLSLSIDLSVCLSSFYLSIHPSIHPSVYLSTITFHIYHFLSLFLTISHCLSWSNIICHSLSWSIIIMHHLSLLSIYTYLKLSIIIHLIICFSLSIFLSIYPILSHPILSYLSYLSYWVLQKKKQPSSYRLSHHTWSPRAPLINVDCPIRTEMAVFEGLSKQSAVTTLNWGKGGTQVSSQWAWQDGCIFWRTRYLSYLAYLYYVSYLSDLSFLFYLTYLSYLSLSLSIDLSTYLYIYRLSILYINCTYISKLSTHLRGAIYPVYLNYQSCWFWFFYLSTWSSLDILASWNNHKPRQETLEIWEIDGTWPNCEKAYPQTRRPEPNAHKKRLRPGYGRSHCFIFSSGNCATNLWSCQKRLGYQTLNKVLLLLHGPATFKRSEPSATAHHCATLLPMRCTCHILQFDTRHLQVAITHVTHWTTHGRSLPSIVMIGGPPLQMKVSFAPKSVENLSRAPGETQSALRTQHEHRDGPIFHLVRIKRGTKSEFDCARVERGKQTQSLDVSSTRTNCVCVHIILKYILPQDVHRRVEWADFHRPRSPKNKPLTSWKSWVGTLHHSPRASGR